MQIIDGAVENIFCLVYGMSGSGKTHLAGTLAELGPVLIIDVDQGGITLRAANAHFQKTYKNVEHNITLASFDKFTDLDQAYKLIAKNDPVLWSKFFGVEIKVPFLWFVWDTWSELQWHMMQKLRTDNSLLSEGGKLDFRKNVQIQHWGAMTDLNKLAIQALRDLKVNMMVIMQEVSEKDELTGEIFGGPAIHGKMVREMPAFFNIVIRTKNMSDGSSVATTKAQGRWPAKTRIGEGQEYKNPSMKIILAG